MSSKGTSIEQKPKHVVKRLLHQHIYIPTEPVLKRKGAQATGDIPQN